MPLVRRFVRSVLCLLLLVIVLVQSGCAIINAISFDFPLDDPAKSVTFDVVRNSYRMTWEVHHRWARERGTPFISENAIWTKEEFPNGDITYRVYVELSLNYYALPLVDSVYVISGHTFFAVPLERRRSESIRVYDPEKKKILTGDSVKIEVLTGLNTYVKRVELFDYEISQEAMKEIDKAQELSFRYYINDMSITIPVTQSELDRLVGRINLDMKTVYQPR